MEALRREMGEESASSPFCGGIWRSTAGGWATGASWRETLAEAWGRERAEAFFRRWVAGSGITSADLPPSEFGALFEDPSLGPLLRTLLEALIEAGP
jgi:hypothetical protein